MNLLSLTFSVLLSLLSLPLLGAEGKKIKVLDALTAIDANSLKAGYSKLSITTSSDWEHARSLNVEIDFVKSDFGGVNKILDPTHVNSSRYKGIRFFAKSPTATLLQVTLAAKDKDGRHLLYKAMAPLSDTWGEVLLPYTSFEASSAPLNDANLARVSSIFVSVHKRDNAEHPEASLQLDGLGFLEK